MGLLSDLIPNSPNKHNENHLAESKENYLWEILGVKGLTISHFNSTNFGFILKLKSFLFLRSNTSLNHLQKFLDLSLMHL